MCLVQWPSYNILGRIERRYGLPNGYFKAKLPHQSRSLYGHDLEDISPAERRRLAWRLPDDFGNLPFSKREEILEWVRDRHHLGVDGLQTFPGGSDEAALRHPVPWV